MSIATGLTEGIMRRNGLIASCPPALRQKP